MALSVAVTGTTGMIILKVLSQGAEVLNQHPGQASHWAAHNHTQELQKLQVPTAHF